MEEHLLKGRIVKRLLYTETVVEDKIKSLDETDFYKKQKRVALVARTERSHHEQAEPVLLCWYLTLLLPFL